ncbi:MAG: Xaa-Pro peptidase family protein [Prevotellaceae bacterium]|nr:Xaa-Pro peptidase family protein [Prevotellaceae bacterium]
MNLITLELTNELPLRWEKIRQALQANATDACLLAGNANIFYAAGRVFGGFVYIPAEGTPIFLVRRPNNLEGEQVAYIRKPEQIPDILRERGMALPKTLLLEGDEIPYSDWLRQAAVFPDATCANGSALLRTVRSVKTAYEVEQMRESAHLHAEVYKQIPSLYRAGMTDLELAIEFERVLRRKGHLGMVRIFGSTMEVIPSSVLAGANAAAVSPYDYSLGGHGQHASLPNGANGTRLAEGMTVMIDSGGNFNGYIADITRTFSIGKLPQQAYDIHQVSLEIQQALAEAGKPGAVCEDLWKLTLQIVEKHGLTDCFMGSEQQAKFVGHGVGIQLNELPVISDRNRAPLQINQIIALEPKFVVAGVGTVGTENTFVVRDFGLEKISMVEEEIIDLNKNS